MEETPDEWVERLVAVFREVRRVLRDDGTLWVEIGDSYCQGHGGSSTEGDGATMRKAARGPGAVSQNEDYVRRIGVRNVQPGYKPKDLLGQPWLLAFALRADGWYLRSEIIWSRPNPMPESVTDRPTKSHSTVFLLSKRPRYFFDADAIREAYQPATLDRNRYSRLNGAEHEMDGRVAYSSYQRTGRAEPDKHGPIRDARPQIETLDGSSGEAPRGPDGRRQTAVKGGDNSEQHRAGERWPNPSGANARSVWTVPTEPTPFAHFATWPQKLVRRMILAGTSERGCCPECGAPWVRETAEKLDAEGRTTNGQKPRTSERRGFDVRMVKTTFTAGWRPSCEHYDDLRDSRLPPSAQDAEQWPTVPAVVLDPFAGSGTTALVARNLGRHSVGIELNLSYLEIAADRLSQLSLLTETN